MLIFIYCVHVNKVKETKTHEEIARWKERFKQDTVYFIEKNQDDIVKAVFNFIDQYSIDMLAVLLETSPFFNVLLKAALLKNYPTINGFLY